MEGRTDIQEDAMVDGTITTSHEAYVSGKLRSGSVNVRGSLVASIVSVVGSGGVQRDPGAPHLGTDGAGPDRRLQIA